MDLTSCLFRRITPGESDSGRLVELGESFRDSQGQRLLMMPVRKYRDLVIAEHPLGKV